jgi:hypothetical protein
MTKDIDSWLTAATLQLDQIVAADSAKATLAAGIDLGATEALATRAYDDYRGQGRFDKAVRSALVFARLTVEKLRASAVDLGERQAAFDGAWRRVSNALAECDRSSHAAEFAELNLAAAALLGVRPGSATFDNTSETIAYLDRAIHVYKLSGEVSRCAEAAILVLRQMRPAPAGRSPNNDRRAFYLRLVDAAGDSLELDPESLLFLAETWAKIWTPEVPRALECANQLAVQAYAKALDRRDDRCAANAKLFTGRLMRDLSGAPDLIAGGLLGGGLSHIDPFEYTAGEFAVAWKHADASRDVGLRYEAAHKLSVVLMQLVFNRGQVQRMDALKQALEATVELGEGANKAGAAANLASMMVQLLLHGLGGSHSEIRSAIDRAIALAIESDDPRVIEACRKLDADYRSTISRKMYDQLHALIQADGKLAADFVAPTILYFKTEGLHDNESTGDAACKVRTLLLFLDEAETEGAMTVSRRGSTVELLFSVPCPKCQHVYRSTMPLLINFDDDPEALCHMQDGVPCEHCGLLNQIQFAYTARAAAFSPNPVVIYPSAWIEHNSGVARQQVLLAAVLHGAFTGVSVRSITTSLPWNAEVLLASCSLTSLKTLQAKAAMIGIITNLVICNEAAIREWVARRPDVADAWDALTPGEAGELLETMMPNESERAVDPRQHKLLFDLCSTFFSRLRQSGVDSALELAQSQARTALEFAFEFLEREQSFDDAMAVADNQDRRIEYLRTFIESAPDFSHDREEVIYQQVMMEADLKDWTEWTAKHEVVLGREGAQKLKRTLLASARQLMESQIAQERAQSTTPAAKQLVGAALAGRGSFVLLLRAFALEAALLPLPTGPASATGSGFDPVIRWRAVGMDPGNVLRLIEGRIGDRSDVVAISNVHDWFASGPIARFFVTNVEWKKLAFSLCAQARKIIFALPIKADDVSPGASEELAAIILLGAQPRTIVVLEGTSSALSDNASSTRELLRRQGFECVLSENDIDGLPSML